MLLEVSEEIQEELLLFVRQTEEENMDKNVEFFDINYNEKIKYFHTYIEELHDNSFTYLEALAEFCRKFDIDEEKVAKYISPSLRDAIYEESVKLNLMKKDKMKDAQQLL